MYCKKVREFTEACTEKTGIPNHPIKMPIEEIEFITKMVNDELMELVDAEDITEQADALVDAIYYICDCAIRHGLNLDPIFDIVHNANMEKVVNGKVLRRRDGKVMKPETWVDPTPLLQKEILRQRDKGVIK